MSSFLEPTGNILAATARMQADTSPDSTNLAKFRRELDALHQSVEQKTVWNPIMEFYATTFDNVHDVMRRNDCTEDMSARLVGIETYLVTDYVIGDAASSGADHVSDALGFELGSWRTTEPGGAPRSVQSSMISGILLMRGSVKTSVSSLLVLENSEMTAPSGPDWNQWRVFGGMVYWWPGSSSTSWSTV